MYSANKFFHPTPENPMLESLLSEPWDCNPEAHDESQKVNNPPVSNRALPFINLANETNQTAVTETSYWPIIRKYILEEDPDAKPVRAICAICWDELHVTCILRLTIRETLVLWPHAATSCVRHAGLAGSMTTTLRVILPSADVRFA
ncbi:hypothetical protein IL306_007288 [Fusarium sp. DS 682]|nr:hypothetical protein IL306_007288 [Fusarium sp. DS 682]